ncbi:MAG: DEAD/DEAH box helicase, partial [Candidatus Heimdallarchaeaceae archaeon]
MNSFDPIKVGQEIVISYGTEFMGNRNVVFSNLIHRYGDPTRPKSEKIKDFIKMKGPFMQALPISTWGTTSWENFANSMKAKYAVSGIDGKIVDLFRDKIKRLYAHQEDAIRSILEDKHTLIVASTGRGKTEAWLIPILQFILIAKRNQVPNHPPNSVKALLVYPTKALAQDQLKRLIKYLYRLNKKIPANEQVTIGIFDGDTPNDSRLENIA